LESKILVWIAYARSATGSGVGQNGVSSFPTCHRVVAGTDRAQRSEDHLSDHGLQQLAKRLLRCLGKSPSDGACLTQAYRLIDALAGTLQKLQGRATPSGGMNRRPKR